MYKIFLLFFLSSFLPLSAEVFTLWPWKGGGVSSGESLAAKLPGAEDTLYTEKLRVNGIHTEITVSALKISYPLLLEQLVRMFKPENLQPGTDEIKVTYNVGKNMVERWLLVNAGPGKPVTMFRILAPEKIPAVTDWPAELPPLPPGAAPVQVIYFSKRKAVYGSFRNAGDDPQSSMRTMSDQLKSSGWEPVGNEGSPAIGGTGDLFMQENPRRILWVNFGEKGSGAFYSKELEK